MKTYNGFIADTYTTCHTAKYYKSYTAYKKNYIVNFGFNDWLESLRDKKPTPRFINLLARTYIIHGERNIEEIPKILVLISNLYNITLPAIYGILTVEYWQHACSKWIKQKENYKLI